MTEANVSRDTFRDLKMNPKVYTLEEIEARVNDVFKQHAEEDIVRNQPVRMGLGIFLEMKWLCEQLRKSTDDKPQSVGKKNAA